MDAWITGRVTDARTGQPLTGAEVSLTGASASQIRQVITGPRGWFAITGLPAGQYQMRIRASGFQPAETQGLTLGVAARLEWNVRLVRAADVWTQGIARPSATRDPLLKIFGPDLDELKSVQLLGMDRANESLDPSVSFAADPRLLAQLPLSGRDAYTLLVSMPGFSTDAATALGLGLAAGGQRPASANFLLDGLENNQAFLGGPRTVLPPEFLEEYRVATNGFSAEFGRTGGYLAQAITRSAGSAWHGLGYVYGQDESLNGNSWTRNAGGRGRLPSRSLQSGLTAGGPIGRLALTASLDRLASDARGDEVQAVLPSRNYAIFADPDRQSAQLIRRFPAVAVPESFGPLGTVTIQPTVTLRRWTGLTRADWRRDRDLWFARVAAFGADQPDRFWTPYPDFVSGLRQPSLSAVIRYERASSARMQNEFRAGWSRQEAAWDRPRPEVPTLVEALQGTVLPGSPLFYGFRDRSTGFEAGHILTLIRESHILRAGASLWWQESAGVLTAGRDGQLVFENIQDFILDRPTLLRAAVNRAELPSLRPPDYQRRWWDRPAVLFLQDSWKAARRLTIHAGLRFEPMSAPRTEGDLFLTAAPDSDLAMSVTRSRLERASPGTRLWDTEGVPWQWRMGAAYAPPRGHLVWRAGYGVFQDRLFGSLWQGVRNNGILLGTFSTGGATGYDFLRPVPDQIAALSGQRFDDSFPPVTAIRSRLRAPRIHSYFAGTQWRPTPGLLVEWNATGSTGRRLITNDVRNRNRFDNPSLPEINWRDHQGSSQYWSLQSSIRWQHRWGFLQAAHTWSRATDNQSDPLEGEFFDLRFTQPGANPIPRPRARFSREGDADADRGPADFDQRHGFVILSSWSWRGFQFSQLAGFRTGLPYSVTASGERADLVGPAATDRAGPGGRFLLDPRAFSAAPPSRVGNTGRNAFRGPGLYNIDASVSRVIRLTEPFRLTLRLDAYNLLNHANLNNPVSELFAPDFGLAVYGRRGRESGFPAAAPFTEQPRTLQILLRLEF